MDSPSPEPISPSEISVGIDKISSAPVELPQGADGMAEKEKAALAHEQEQFKRELGWLGHPFGGRREKPGNISIVVILFCFAGLALIYLKPPAPGSDMSFERIWGGLTSMITLVLGYLFGSNDKNGK